MKKDVTLGILDDAVYAGAEILLARELIVLESPSEPWILFGPLVSNYPEALWLKYIRVTMSSKLRLTARFVRWGLQL